MVHAPFVTTQIIQDLDLCHAQYMVQIVYAVNGAVALEIAEQPAITLHPADAFVFHPRAVADPLGVKVGPCGLAAHAEMVVATLVFGSNP